MEPFKVLLIDDNREIKKIVHAMLEHNYGHRIRLKCISNKKDFENAQNIVLQYKPDLVLLDYMLEPGYGNSLSVKIYVDLLSSEEFHLCPIFFITGLLEEDVRIKILKEVSGLSGKIEIIEKPFTEKRLVDIVDACIEARGR